MKQKFWGIVAILLGVWEAAAFSGKCPTITTTWRCLHAKRPRGAWAVLLAFEVGLLAHMKGKPWL